MAAEDSSQEPATHYASPPRRAHQPVASAQCQLRVSAGQAQRHSGATALRRNGTQAQTASRLATPRAMA